MRLRFARGVTLIETIIFLVVVSIALVALVKVYTYAVVNSVDPVVRTRALELAQAQLDEILSRKFDENTPSGGVPACDTTGEPACAGIAPDGDFDDVGDFHGNPTISDPNHTVTVSVTNAGADLGLPAAQARRISVTVSVTASDSLTLSVYKTNF